MAGNLRVLIDQRADLGRAFHLRFAAEPVHDQLLAIGDAGGWLGIRGKGAGHRQDAKVAAADGRERFQQHEIVLVALVALQRRRQVIRFDDGIVYAGKIPGFGLLVEEFGLLLVIARIDFHLVGEQVLRIAQVLLQDGRQGANVLEQVGIGIAIPLDDGVGLVVDVIVDMTIKGVDHDLDRIADVIELVGILLAVETGGGAFGNRIPVGCGVGVENPENALGRDDDVGIVIELEERREFAHPFDDVAMEQGPAFAADVDREEQVFIPEVDGKQQLAEQG